MKVEFPLTNQTQQPKSCTALRPQGRNQHISIDNDLTIIHNGIIYDTIIVHKGYHNLESKITHYPRPAAHTRITVHCVINGLDSSS